MQDGRAKGPRAERKRRTSRSGGASGGERTVAGALGNEEIAKRLRDANLQRDELIALVEARLTAVRDTQRQEVALTERGANWAHWRLIADSHRTELSKPEPTQWRAVAVAYEEALRAACRGDLQRGRQLVQRALDVEERTTADLTALVDSPDQHPALADGFDVAAGTAVPPSAQDLIDEIKNTTASMPNPMNKPRDLDPWWTEDEDEEDDGADEP